MDLKKKGIALAISSEYILFFFQLQGAYITEHKLGF